MYKLTVGTIATLFLVMCVLPVFALSSGPDSLGYTLGSNHLTNDYVYLIELSSFSNSDIAITERAKQTIKSTNTFNHMQYMQRLSMFKYQLYSENMSKKKRIYKVFRPNKSSKKGVS